MNNKANKLVLLLLLVVGISALLVYRDKFTAEALDHWLQNTGLLAPIVFVLIYAVGTVFFLPGSLLTLIGGALFGPYWGTFYNLTGATLGAMLSFLVSRHLASEWVAQKSKGIVKRLINGVENEGWRFVAFTRLVPLFPFNLLNYALGLTKVSFTQYSIATYVCMLPGAIAYTYLGYAGKEAIAGGEGLIQKFMLAIALLAVAGFLPRLISRLRNNPMISVDDLKQRLDTDKDILLLDVRTPEDYTSEQGHIDGSMLIPVEQLTDRVDEINSYLEKPVFIICRTDRKSAQAIRVLVQHGFIDVHVVKMGMTDWISQGYPVVK